MLKDRHDSWKRCSQGGGGIFVCCYRNRPSSDYSYLKQSCVYNREIKHEVHRRVTLEVLRPLESAICLLSERDD